MREGYKVCIFVKLIYHHKDYFISLMMLVEIEDNGKAYNFLLEILERASTTRLSLPFLYSIS